MKNYLTPNYKPFSLIPHSAKGVWVYDKKGKDFLDLTGGIAVNCLGHCHAKILKTLEKQAKKNLAILVIIFINSFRRMGYKRKWFVVWS